MKTRKRIYFILIVSIFGIGFFACSDWEKTVSIPDNGPVDSKHVVVLEEFTGSSCPNCPKGIAATDAIKNIYPYNVIVIEVHSLFLSAPITKGQVKLNNPDADAIETFLGAYIGKPEAAINRLYDNVDQPYRFGTPASWKSYVDDELKKEPQVALTLSKIFDSVSRELKLTINVKALAAINEPVHLHCGITESNIIEDQDDSNTILFNFVHNHVLRKMFTPIPGEKIADALTIGQSIDKSYSFIMPKDSILWKAENCNIFAYASLDANKKYILQGAEGKVK